MGDTGGYYARQLSLPGWGPAGQDALAEASVLVVGVGGLGCPVLEALARAGVGRLVFCDGDRVEVSNLPRQTLFTAADVGRPKVEAAAEALTRANPAVTLEPKAVRVDAANVRALVESVDLVVDGSDLFSTKFLVHDACRSAGKPLVTASAHQWEGQVLAFPFDQGRAGCWRCLYAEAPEDGCVGTCAQDGVAGALTGMVGNFQALTALRLLLRLEGPEACAAWIIDAADWTPRVLRWKPNPTCDCAHGPGDWAWLNSSFKETPVSNRIEYRWEELNPDQRQVVVDVREPFEIRPGEWEFFGGDGSEVVHFPFTRWAFTHPEWDPSKSYLIVCAHGVRSANALKTVPAGVRALSLAGGVVGLELD
jgi:adenylyltransferase/sulfurtransferase